jgi:hypothetical protein
MDRPDFHTEPRTAANMGEQPRKRCASRDGIRSCSRLFVGLKTANGPQRARKGTAKGPQPSPDARCFSAPIARTLGRPSIRDPYARCSLTIPGPEGAHYLMPGLSANHDVSAPPSGLRITFIPLRAGAAGQRNGALARAVRLVVTSWVATSLHIPMILYVLSSSRPAAGLVMAPGPDSEAGTPR